MRKNYYSAETLRHELDAFEARFGYSSEEHVRRRYSDDGNEDSIPPFESHVWADTYHEWRRLNAR